MKAQSFRIFIFPRDIVNLTGYSVRKAQRILQDIRLCFKEKETPGNHHQRVR